MDRNSVIGFSLLAVLLIGYVVYNQKSQEQYLEQKRADSIAYAKAHPKPVVDSSKLVAAAPAAAFFRNSLLFLLFIFKNYRTGFNITLKKPSPFA